MALMIERYGWRYSLEIVSDVYDLQSISDLSDKLQALSFSN